MIEVGLNLYSVRNLIKDEKSLTDTVIKLKDMGYSYFQYSGGEYLPERLKRVSGSCGVPFVLTHVPMDRIISDTKKLIEEHLSFGCRNIGLGSMPRDVILDEEKLKQTVEKLNRSAEVMIGSGCRFFYHHHHSEFMRLSGGETIFDYIAENAPHINFTVDTYWLQYGGVEINSVIERLAGRIECAHLKDYMLAYTEDKGFVPVFAPVGDGNIDFAKVIKIMKNSGTKYFLVEQDNACEFDNPLEQVERSIRYLKSNF